VPNVKHQLFKGDFLRKECMSLHLYEMESEYKTLFSYSIPYLVTEIGDIENVFIRDFRSHGDLGRIFHFLFHLLWQDFGEVGCHGISPESCTTYMFS